MATILALDTTAEFGSVALFANGRLVEEAVLHSADGFGHVIFGHIHRLLARHGLQPCGIDCFAAASGPGSFTGVRVGLTAAKGLAEACNRPVVAVSNLKALAWHGSAPLRGVFIDARRGEIYSAVYSASLTTVVDERVSKFQPWFESLGSLGEVELITADPALYPAIHARPAPRALAAGIAAIAHATFLDGNAQDPAGVDANYVRRSDAELFWKDR
jgi:tRNA threonylcarbamoyladenosine biosynthesis protein TsaB